MNFKKLVNCNINKIEFYLESEISIIEACKQVGVNVPRFCYHELLSVSGNCRMCLIEIEGVEKPFASCVSEINEGISILTDTSMVKKSRENVIEGLLLSHPLDCPICDQAGECDLQEQSKFFGNNTTKHFFTKKEREDKYFTPIIKTIMTRCISCTRCIRYCSEITETDYFGTLNRGGNTEIGSYINKIYKSHLSGNVIDLCPVGALTTNSQKYKIRPWEINLHENLDVTDSMGSSLYINYVKENIERILPKQNNEINGSIISDRARFFYDSIFLNRVSNELNFNNFNFFLIYKSKFFTQNCSFFIDEKTDFETFQLLRFLTITNSKKIKVYSVSSENSLNCDFYISKKTNIISIIEDIRRSSVLFLLGLELNKENHLIMRSLNFIRKSFYFNFFKLVSHYNENEGLKSTFSNISVSSALSVFDAKDFFLSKKILKTNDFYLLIGDSFFNKFNNGFIFINKIKQNILKFQCFFISNYINSKGKSMFNFNIFSLKRIINISNVFKKNVLYTKNVNKIHFYLEYTSFVFNVFHKKCYHLTTNFFESNRLVLREVTSNIFIFHTHKSSYFPNKYLIPILTPLEIEQTYITDEYRVQKTKPLITFYSNIGIRNSFFILQDFFNRFLFKSKAIFIYFKVIFFQHISEMYTIKSRYKNLKSCINIYFFLEDKILFKKVKEYTLYFNYPIKNKIKSFLRRENLSRNSRMLYNWDVELTKAQINFF